MNSSQEKIKQINTNKKALRYVIYMGLTLIITVSICVVIWQFIPIHRFDLLGQLIMVAGGIIMVIGVLCMGDSRSSTLLRHIFRTVTGKSHQIAMRNQDPRNRDSFTDRQVVIFFIGSGLLCLFIGNLIVLGL